MFKNYLKIAFNNFLQQKLYSLINILGMATGLACCLLLALYVLFEFSYDKYHAKADRIYRISYLYSSDNASTDSAMVAPLLAEDFDEVEEAVRIYGNTPGLISLNEEEAFYEDGVRFADNTVFRVFDFDWLQGDPRIALTSPNTVVLTQGMAEKYFPGDNALGQTLYLSAGRIPMTVAGIIRDLPDNTHLSFSMLGSMDLGVTRSGRSTQDVLENWNFRIFHTYVLLREGTDIDLFRSDLSAFIERRIPFVGPTFVDLDMMNIQALHFNSRLVGDWKEKGNLIPLLILSAVVVCILLIACINFMNLSTARSSRRAREIGMRKVLGAERNSLVMQFLGESVLMTVMAMCVAFMLVELALPIFNAFVGKSLSTSFIGWEKMILGMIVFAVFIGIAAGSYPAFFLSSYQVAKVLKGEVSRGKAGVLFRNILVLAQFSISIILIVATSVIYQQMEFARNIDLGFKKEQMVILEGSLQNGLGPQWRLMRNRLQRHPDILGAAASTSVPLTGQRAPSFVTTPGIEEELQLYPYAIGPNFFNTYGIEVMAGRGFSEDFATDQGVYPTTAGEVGSQAYVLSEEALSVFGWTAEEALGKQLTMSRPEYVEEGLISGPVIGVVSDVLPESVRDAVKPLFYMMPPDTVTSLGPQYYRLTVSLRTDNVNAVMTDIASIWEEYNPETEMRSRFLESAFNLVYQDEDKQGEMFRFFAAIAIILACFGLFGLAAFNAERRTKEIGVRKVMGGSVWQILFLLTNDFSKLVLISNVIAWPVAYFAMTRWLENFAYRIDLTPLIFIGSGLIALCIAWVTVGGTAAKAASQKPVLALRYE